MTTTTFSLTDHRESALRRLASCCKEQDPAAHAWHLSPFEPGTVVER
jgi:hypothetical protein